MNGMIQIASGVEKIQKSLGKSKLGFVTKEEKEIAKKLRLNYFYRFTGYGALTPTLSDLKAIA